MSATENRKLIEEIFAGLEKGDGAAFVRSLSDDFTWHMIGSTAWSGSYRGKAEVRERLLAPLYEQFATRYRTRLHRIVADEHHVTVEYKGEVTTKTGKAYNNTYCWVCRIENGKLKELTEYMDTELVSSALTAPRAA